MSKADIKGSNLVKGYRLAGIQAETRVIDSNSSIQEKLERIRFVMPAMPKETNRDEGSEPEFVDGLDALMLDALTTDSEEGFDEDGNPVSNIIKAGVPEQAMPVYDGPTPEELIADAEAQIEEMRQAAEADIEAAKAEAYNEGMNAGYNDGMAKANAEVQAAWQELEQARVQFNAECEQYIADIEPEFIKTLTAIYEKVIQINLSDQQDVIVKLLHNTLSQIESGKNYLIHVSADDYAYVSENRAKLITASMPDDVTIDIVEDFAMKAGDAMIETASGIYDCGVGTQMETLKKKLELLSFTP